MRVVSTHSRPKAAALCLCNLSIIIVGFNTQPPEGGCGLKTPDIQLDDLVSTHSRPKAAAHCFCSLTHKITSFNTQPPEGGCLFVVALNVMRKEFQHTAARRRLLHCWSSLTNINCFNTQPPEGGCTSCAARVYPNLKFQHTAARRRLLMPTAFSHFFEVGFNTQPPEGGCCNC